MAEYFGEVPSSLQVKAQFDGWKFGTIKGVPSVLCPEHAKDYLEILDL